MGMGMKEDRLGIGWARGEGDPKVQPGCLAAEEEMRKAILIKKRKAMENCCFMLLLQVLLVKYHTLVPEMRQSASKCIWGESFMHGREGGR